MVESQRKEEGKADVIENAINLNTTNLKKKTCFVPNFFQFAVLLEVNDVR